MLRAQSILLSTCICLGIYSYSQPLTAGETVDKYSIAQKRLLVRSTAEFINLITQNSFDQDSIMLLSCRLTGTPFLTAYNEYNDGEAPSIGAELINKGRITEATQFLKTLDTNKQTQLLIDLAKWYLYKAGRYKRDLDSCNYFIRDALGLSSTMSNKNKWYECLDLLGEYNHQIGNEAESKRIYLQLAGLEREDENKKTLANALFHLGISNPKIDSLGIIYLDSSIAIYKQLRLKEREIELLWKTAGFHLGAERSLMKNDLVRILEIQQSIGYGHSLFAEYFLTVVSLNQSDYLDALKHADAASENMKWSGIYAMQGTFNMRLGSVYASLGRNDEALELFRKGFETRSSETHIFWFKSLLYAITLLLDMQRPSESLALLQEIIGHFPPITPWEKAQIFSLEGECNEKTGNYKSADLYYMDFLNLTKKYPDLDRYGEFSETYFAIAGFYISISNLKAARLFLKRAMSVNNKSMFNNAQISYLLFKIDSAEGNYQSALNHYTQYKAFNDSDKNREQRIAFDELNIKYGAEKKDNDIKLLQKEKQLQGTMLLQSKYTRNWILGAVGLLLLIVSLLVYNSRLKQRTNKKLESQQSEIEMRNTALRHLVDEKDWLAKEIHHRVKNNLQIVMSLLNSQSAFIENDAALTAIHDSQHRVQAMSLIHQKLYNTENVSSIDMSLYIQELVAYLSASFNTGQRLRFDLNIEPLEMDVSQAVPLGLILNEAITNSIKYAFPNERKGVISISLSPADHNHCLLIISDNGIGMPPVIHNKKQASLGMSLMMGLTEDISGDFSIKNGNGTTIQISFLNERTVIGESMRPSTFVANS